MLTDKRRLTIALMVNNYLKQVEIVGIDNVDISLEEYLRRMGLSSKELEYANRLQLTQVEQD